MYNIKRIDTVNTFIRIVFIIAYLQASCLFAAGGDSYSTWNRLEVLINSKGILISDNPFNTIPEAINELKEIHNTELISALAFQNYFPKLSLAAIAEIYSYDRVLASRVSVLKLWALVDPASDPDTCLALNKIIAKLDQVGITAAFNEVAAVIPRSRIVVESALAETNPRLVANWLVAGLQDGILINEDFYSVCFMHCFDELNASQRQPALARLRALAQTSDLAMSCLVGRDLVAESTLDDRIIRLIHSRRITYTDRAYALKRVYTADRSDRIDKFINDCETMDESSKQKLVKSLKRNRDKGL